MVDSFDAFLEAERVMDSLTIIVTSHKTLLGTCNMQSEECAWASLILVKESHRRKAGGMTFRCSRLRNKHVGCL